MIDHASPLFEYTVRVYREDYIASHYPAEEFKKLESIGLTIIIKEEEEGDNTYSSGQRFNQGILDSRDKKFIIEKGLNPVEISGYLNGNYAALEDLEVYKIYDKEDIKHNLK